ncbi:retrotransposon protein, putative, ty1-copia subclass [Tanacetum coccineum]
MERGFLSQKGSRGGRGVKEKDKVVAAKDGAVPFVTVASGNTQEENVGTSSLDVSFGSLLRCESKRKGLNFHTLITQAGNGANVCVPMESISVVSERYVNLAYGFFLGKRVAYPVVANYVRNTWGKYGLVKCMFSSSMRLFFFQFSYMGGLDPMLENGPWCIRNNPLILKKCNQDVNLMKEDVVNVSVWVKLHGIPIAAFTEDGLSVIAMNIGIPLMLESYRSDMCIQSWGRSSYARALIEIRADVEFKDTIVMAMLKLTGRGFIRAQFPCCEGFGHIQKECPKNPGLGVAKNLKKPSQAPRGVPVGSKVGFKPTKEYRHVTKKPNVNTNSNKKKGVDPTKEVSNSNTFDVLNAVVNDEELGKVNLVDDDGKPLKKVDYPGNHDSDDDVCLVDNDMARFMATETVGFGTKSLLEQLIDSYENGDYDEDLYYDDMYKGQDLPDKLQDICDNLDIRVRGSRKK